VTTAYARKIEEKIAFLEGEARNVERDRKWAHRVPWLLIATCPTVLYSWAAAVIAAISVLTLWFMALYILKFRREEYEGDIRDLRVELDRVLAEAAQGAAGTGAGAMRESSPK